MTNGIPMRRGRGRPKKTETPPPVHPAPPMTPPVTPPEPPKKPVSVVGGIDAPLTKTESKRLYDLVMARHSKSAWFTVPGRKAIEMHSADDWAVYVFPERKGNGDKSRCDVIPLREFVELVGLE